MSIRDWRARALCAAIVGLLVGGACSGIVRGPSSSPAGPRSVAPGSAPSASSPPITSTPVQHAERILPGPHRPWIITPIRPAQRAVLVPRNWRPGCPVPLSALRWVTVRYWGFDRETHVGPLIVNARVVEDVRWVFQQLFQARYPIKNVALPPRYHKNVDEKEAWDDTRNVTSSFNCRPVTDDPGTWSQHAFGLAIDINPLENPYVRGDGSVLRKAAKPYRDRSLTGPAVIHEGDVVVRSFDAIGWGWGGRWVTLKDYMHFSLTGR